MLDVEKLAIYNKLDLEARERINAIVKYTRKRQASLAGITDLHELWTLKRRIQECKDKNVKAFKKNPEEFYKLMEEL